MAGGAALYFMLHSYLLVSDGPPLLRHIKGQRIFERVLVALSWRLARGLEDVFGTRRLQPQLLLLVSAAVLAAIVPIYERGLPSGGSVHTQFDFAFALLWMVGITCALGAAYQAKFHRLAALILLGGTGLVTCISFVWLSAPDLALTQLIVETVTTVLLLLGLRWLPKRVEDADRAGDQGVIRWYRGRDFAISVAVGSGLAALAYAVMTRPAPETIAHYFVENAYTQGGGTNIVNVILVDFRGVRHVWRDHGARSCRADSLRLVAAVPPGSREHSSSRTTARPRYRRCEHPDREKGDTVKSAMAIPSLIMTLLFPVIGILALYLLLRGHDLPGGGFVAGVTMAVAFIVQYMAHGTVWVEARLQVLPVLWMGFGLLLAGVTGAAAWLFGRPFLTSSFSYLEIPLIGSIPITTALLFDLGVFALVLGATVLMLIAIAHQTVRSHRVLRGRETAVSTSERQ